MDFPTQVVALVSPCRDRDDFDPMEMAFSTLGKLGRARCISSASVMMDRFGMVDDFLGGGVGGMEAAASAKWSFESNKTEAFCCCCCC